MAGYMFLNDSWYTRSRGRGRFFESSIVISPSFQGRGLGTEVVILELSIALEMGYVASVNDWLASNRRMNGVVRRTFGNGVLAIGTIPRGAYTAGGIGWDDQIIMWHDAQEPGIPSFTQLAEQSRTTRRRLKPDDVDTAVSKL